jgi:SAM-dependent methyltransferase
MGEHGTSYRIAADDAAVARERDRLAALTRTRDPQTLRVLSQLGITNGWRCLEVGAGSGTIAAWLAGHVVPDGRVLSIDVDLRFHCDPVPGLEVREVDVVADPLPEGPFDLVHTRALLQHLHERETVLDRLVAAVRPGGWLVVEDSYWTPFEDQPLPEPLRKIADLIHAGLRRREGWDPNVGARLLGMLSDRGVGDLDVVGTVLPMRARDGSGAWWFPAIEQAGPQLVRRGLISAADLDAAIGIVQSDDFVMMGPVSIAVSGRVPADAATGS